MPETIALQRPAALDAVVTPPGSKSLTNRALTLAAIAEGRSRISGALAADDTVLMKGCLEALGLDVVTDGDVIEIEGRGGGLRCDGIARLDVGLAGTVARFLTAVLAASPGRARIDGTERMRERPMDMLIDALRDQGAAIQCLAAEGFLPVLVGPHYGSLKGGTIRLARPASSQFVSALVLAGLLAERPTTIVLEQGTPARPYIDMTLATVRAFGGDAQWRDDREITVAPGRLSAQDYAVEPDASGASYFLALAAIHGGKVEVPGVGASSLQGDAKFAALLGQMGAEVEQRDSVTIVRGTGTLHGGDFDLADTPDMTLTLAVAAAHATSPTTITGVDVLRHHESDRIAAIATELRKLGVHVDERPDGLSIRPPSGSLARGVTVGSHGDHRMAMALSLVGDIVVEDPACVAKTYPRYFDELRNLGMVAAHGG
ncbi:MAG: 3-phosphoshikimate 1-carboxyvinyltransferase [Myxococcota bacterium]